ncbi:RNA-binding S4 domain-containing protein [Corynebacterium falsenii]|uniref:RNA-binding S4 domain-containing protein n=1 Tax=Corynebacterium falsenii TaxID=108486 RepID=A0A418Q9E4_9CORY|nr:RNA-binding S4 domain-containing protein [Corynebacterium falsenii]RIX36316.1 RNA-binding S4 domain-containing protein [Corynebacterium falsenii]
MQLPEVPIRDGEIRLGQFIKLANLVETGGIAKEVIASGAVLVNGEVDTRRGKVLRPGDEVQLIDLDSGEPMAGATVGSMVASDTNGGAGDHNGDPDDLGEYFDEATADDDFDPEKWRNM